MSSPGNSTINTKHRYFSTRKTHNAAQACPEHTVVGQHQPNHYSIPGCHALPGPAM